MSECLFCKIAEGELDTEFVYEDDRVVAFNDVNPQAPVHLLIIPREHFESIQDMSDERLIGHLFFVGKEVAKQLGVDGYRMVVNTGKDAGQAVFHTHLHLLAGRRMNWPPG
jgi:histidine triad (HIT) family protein